MQYKMKRSAKKDSKYIDDRLDEFNYSRVPPEEGTKEEDLVFKITDGEGKIIAGCILEIDRWKIADLDILWVEEKYRRQGMGSALIRAAEQAARERNCPVMGLGTFDFQARPLYEKHGYTLCGTIREWPKGHENYSFMKCLDRPSPEYVPSKVCTLEIKSGTEEDAEIIGDGLGAYNDAQTKLPDTYIKLNRKLVDEDGRLAAGIVAGVDGWNTGYIHVLWVEEQYRRQGLGTRLLRRFERNAKEKGAYMILAFSVFDWQTEFFEKHGYTAVGVLEDCPKGHRCCQMQKML